MLSESNFLILDEPTNHLDILSREALEEALQSYEGTMLIVSHDRYFINKLANRIYKLDKTGAKEFKGNYDFYIQNDIIKEETKEIKEKNTSYKEKKEREAQERKRLNRIKKIEEEISNNEVEIAKLEALSLSSEVGSNYEKALEISQKIDGLKQKNEELFEEWSKSNLLQK
jgi:ATP-binding cassette subfamily F protein 3